MASISDILSGVKKGEITPIAIRFEPGMTAKIGAAIKLYIPSENGKRAAKINAIAIIDLKSVFLSSTRC